MVATYWPSTCVFNELYLENSLALLRHTFPITTFSRVDIYWLVLPWDHDQSTVSVSAGYGRGHVCNLRRTVSLREMTISRAWRRAAVAPLLTEWSCCGLAQSHRDLITHMTSHWASCPLPIWLSYKEFTKTQGLTEKFNSYFCCVACTNMLNRNAIYQEQIQSLLGGLCYAWDPK